MTDDSARVSVALTGALAPVKVYYAYPLSWTALPVVSFYELSNSVAATADDDEVLSRVSYSVDVWANTPDETHMQGGEIDAAMRALGYHRQGAYDLFEQSGSSGIHHRNMTYTTTI
ncbi:MAG: hypothetical protein PHI27_08780 [Eubacteriales bacterium]|nr:hypothetical protein [Eubacteriales bacterium]MDD3882334.1 hypothetical protein [Eubacteriales bacterium]MDD4512080.1 hypothetical protein [Eubacteriales bacterium]